MLNLLAVYCVVNLLTLIFSQAITECPNDWLPSPASQTCVKVFKNRENWDQARLACQKLDADLVRIPNWNMNRFVTGLINTTGDTKFWIGLHDTKKENTFVWLDDTKAATYTAWAKGQPNNYKSTRGSGDQDCAEIGTYTPQWQDDWCNRRSGYICETSKSRAKCDADWIESRSSGTCLKLISQRPYSWEEARRYCSNSLGGDLVKITNVQMDTMIYGVAVTRKISAYWIGLHDVPREGRYQWLDETNKPTYLNWADGQPNNYLTGKWSQPNGTGQDCGEVIVKKDRPKWYDTKCGQALAFVCERRPQTATTTTTTTSTTTTTTTTQPTTTEATTTTPTARTTPQKLLTSQTNKVSRLTSTVPTTITFPRTTPRRITLRTTAHKTSAQKSNPRTTTPAVETTTPSRNTRTTGPAAATSRRVRTTAKPITTLKTLQWTGPISTFSVRPQPTVYIPKSNQNKTKTPAASPAVVTPYPGAWLVNPISGTLLRASRDQKSWIDARTACQNDGGDLVKIPDLAMNDFVSALIRMNGGGRHWIGLHDVQTENKFVWLDEDEMAQFTYWAKGQPNNYIHNKLKSEGQDCVEIGTFAPKWQDDVCSTKSKYVCEKQDGVSLNPTHGQPTVWFASPQSDTEVKIFSDLKSWSDARQACQAEGGDLVKILQSNMNKFLADIIRVRGGGRHWIGLNDLAQENRFVWLDEDKQANYTNWAAGQPNNYRINKTTESGGQHCVEIGTFAPRWQDDMCSRLSKFICGRPVTKSATINRTAGSFKCPDNWSASPLSGTCVKVYEGKKTWPGARAVCKAYGGDLVKIRDQDMNSFLAGLLTKDSTKQYWIGLRDTQGDKFQWLDETEKASYTNWASKEHSKTMMEESKRLQNCAVIGNLIPKWQSVSCSQSAGFICEIAVRSFASAHTGQGHTDHSSLIVGIVLCVCLVAAGLAAFVVYKRRHSRKSLMSGDATVSFTNLVDESIFDESPSGL